MTNTYNRVKNFNTKAGKLPEIVGSVAYWSSVENQLKRISEELEETYLAIKNKDINGMIDGGADLDVTVAGLNFLMGADYPNVISEVLDNNDKKFTTDDDEIQQIFEDFDSDEYQIVYNELDETPYYSISRLSDQKVMKFPNHPSPDFSKFVPELVQSQVYLSETEELPEELLKILDDARIPVLRVGEIEGEVDEVLTLLLNEYGNCLVSFEIATGQVADLWPQDVILSGESEEDDA